MEGKMSPTEMSVCGRATPLITWHSIATVAAPRTVVYITPTYNTLGPRKGLEPTEELLFL